MIQRKKTKTGYRYLFSDQPLVIGQVAVVTTGPATGQRVRPSATITGKAALALLEQ